METKLTYILFSIEDDYTNGHLRRWWGPTKQSYYIGGDGGEGGFDTLGYNDWTDLSTKQVLRDNPKLKKEIVSRKRALELFKEFRLRKKLA